MNTLSNCPHCNSELYVAAQSGQLSEALCSGCQIVFPSGVQGRRRRRVSLRAVASCIVGVTCLALFSTVALQILLDRTHYTAVTFFAMFLLIVGILALPLGTRAIDDIDLPYKELTGRWLARVGMMSGFLSVAAMLLFNVWMSFQSFEFRPRSYGLNIRLIGAASAPRPSVFGDMPDVSGDDRYHVILSPQGTEWMVLNPISADPEIFVSGFHTEFANPDFDDSDWLEARDTGGGIGYGQAGDARYGLELRTPNPNQRYTAYFRARFTTQETIRSMALELFCDDGIIVYIDGQEVTRWNMPQHAPEQYALFASRAVTGDDESVQLTTVFDVGELPAGEHILAISLHNNSPTSSDLGIRQLTLYGAKVDR